MKTLFEQIQALKLVRNISKQGQIIQGIINAIDAEILKINDPLPSLAKMKANLGFAEKTIVRAYAELKSRGIIESQKRKGFFIVDNRTRQAVRVMLLMYAFEMFQKIFFNAFKLSLGENVQVDTFFHHGNLKVFSNFITENLGKYSMFIVAPVQAPETRALLSLIPPNKILIVDRQVRLGKKYSFVVQQFESSTFRALERIREPIQKFNKIILFHRLDKNYPEGTLFAFQKFVSKYRLNAAVEDFYMPGSLEKGTVYFSVNDNDLWELLLDCQHQKFLVGEDVGIISQDDTPAKSIVYGGITTISTDFRRMAQKSADFVLNRTLIQEIIPAEVIRRKSL